MLKCRDIAISASDYVEKNVPLRQRLAVAMHLLMCGDCRGFVRHLRIALAYFNRLGAEQISQSEAEKIAVYTIDESKNE